MSKVKDTDYLCLSAMLRAKEAKMLTKDKLERILTEPSFADAARTLVDCGYEDMSAMDTKAVNEALERRRAAEVEDVSSMTADKAVVDVFRLKYEYHNAKAIVKSGGKAENLVSEAGRNPAEVLYNAYETGDYDGLPAEFAAAFEEAKLVLARTGNPQLADFVLDRAYFGELGALAESTGNEFIAGYVRELVDAANVRTAVRIMKMGKNAQLLSSALIPGGSIDCDAIIAASESRDGLKQLYAPTRFAKALETEGMTAFELACDNAVNSYLAECERVAFGPSVVMGYLAAVENEIMSVRIIMTGKLMGIESKLLRERLRDSYV